MRALSTIRACVYECPQFIRYVKQTSMRELTMAAFERLSDWVAGGTRFPVNGHALLSQLLDVVRKWRQLSI